MQNSFVDVDILAQKVPDIKPDERSQQLEQQRSQQLDSASGSGRISQHERSPEYRRCPHCASENLKSGAGKKGGEQSIRCTDCRKFLGYQPIPQLKRLRRQRRLTDCLNLLESHGVSSETAQLFVLSEVSAIGGES
jgi:hypothetical protein